MKKIISISLFIFLIIFLGLGILYIQQEYFPTKLIDFGGDNTADADFICRSARYHKLKVGDEENLVSSILGKPYYREPDGGYNYSLDRWAGTIIIFYDKNRKIQRKTCGFG